MGNEFKVGDRVRGNFGVIGTVTMTDLDFYYKILFDGVTGSALRYGLELTLAESPRPAIPTDSPEKTRRVKFSSLVDENEILSLEFDRKPVVETEEVEKSEKDRMMEFFSRSAHDRK